MKTSDGSARNSERSSIELKNIFCRRALGGVFICRRRRALLTTPSATLSDRRVDRKHVEGDSTAESLRAGLRSTVESIENMSKASALPTALRETLIDRRSDREHVEAVEHCERLRAELRASVAPIENIPKATSTAESLRAEL